MLRLPQRSFEFLTAFVFIVLRYHAIIIVILRIGIIFECYNASMNKLLMDPMPLHAHCIEVHWNCRQRRYIYDCYWYSGLSVTPPLQHSLPFHVRNIVHFNPHKQYIFLLSSSLSLSVKILRWQLIISVSSLRLVCLLKSSMMLQTLQQWIRYLYLYKMRYKMKCLKSHWWKLSIKGQWNNFSRRENS